VFYTIQFRTFFYLKTKDGHVISFNVFRPGFRRTLAGAPLGIVG